MKKNKLKVIIIGFLISLSGLCFSQSNQTQYHYDNLNRLTKVEYSNDVTIEYFYDELGNRIGKTITVIPNYDVYFTQTPTIPQDTATAGDVLSIASIIGNRGNTMTASAIDFYWSLDTLKDGSDVALATSMTDTIAPISMVADNFSATLPTNIGNVAGYILCILDENNTLTEIDEGNNMTYIPLYVLPLCNIALSEIHNDVSCNGGTNGSATVSLSGGNSPFTYAWNDNSIGNSPIANNLSAGWYSMTVTDVFNCFDTISINIQEPSLLTVSSTVTDVTCFGGNDGTTTLNIIGGVPTYTENWGSINPNTLSAGTYLFTVTDANNCVITDTAVINEPSLITNSMTATICQGQNYEGYTISGNFVDTLINGDGCDSVRTIDLTVNPTHLINLNPTICQGDSITVGTIIHNSTGVYTDTLANIHGCDSIVITDLTVNPTQLINLNPTICQGDSITVGTIVHNSTGVYTDTLANIHGCDSIVITDLTVNPTQLINQNLTICQGESILIGTIIHNSTGIYTDTLANLYNCDSIVITDLTVNPTHLINQNLTICQGESISVGMIVHNSTGIYTDTLMNIYGCDSIMITDLTVNPTHLINQNSTICQGESILVGTIIHDSTGIYTDTLVNIYNCDSIIITDLTVNPTQITVIDTIICGNETFVAAGISHNTIGNYTYILQTWQGCDSMVTLNLTVNPTHLINQNFIICQGESILVGTIIHDSTGIYTDTLVNIYGCDSIVITDLNINPTQVTNLTDTICHGETLDFNGQIVDTSGTYQVTLQTWQGCDSIVNLDLTVQPSITILNTIIIDGTSIPLGSIDITPSGDTLTQQYLWSNGVTTQDVSSLGTGFYGLTITDNIGCQDTFSFEIGVVNTFFMDNKKQIQVKLYPNPTRENQITTLEFDNILSKDLTYRIVGVDGKILEVGVLSKNELKHQIKVPQVVGMYYLQLFSENRQIKAIPFIVR